MKFRKFSLNLYIPEPSTNIKRLLPSPGSILFTLLVVGLLVWAQTAGALPGLASPQNELQNSQSTIPYQGRLADADGNPVTATVNMIFRLYDQASGGAPLWEEQWTGSNGVQVSDGLFNVMLGSLTPIPQAVITGHDNLFLGITAGTDDEMTPRVQLGSVPFAVQALTVPDASITTDKIAKGAVTPKEMRLGKYKFDRPDSNTIIYQGTNGQQSQLDMTSCPDGKWCCNADKSICYLNGTSGDSILEFSLVNSPSISCALLHSDDDAPGASKRIYYATDAGNSCHMGTPCARLSREGSADSPISVYATYQWLCGW